MSTKILESAERLLAEAEARKPGQGRREHWIALGVSLALVVGSSIALALDLVPDGRPRDFCLVLLLLGGGAFLLASVLAVVAYWNERNLERIRTLVAQSETVDERSVFDREIAYATQIRGGFLGFLDIITGHTEKPSKQARPQ